MHVQAANPVNIRYNIQSESCICDDDDDLDSPSNGPREYDFENPFEQSPRQSQIAVGYKTEAFKGSKVINESITPKR